MSFGSDVLKWTLKAEAQTEAVVKEAAQEMAIAASVPIAQGGLMPVDTGFLRNSIGAAVGQVPTLPSRVEDDGMPPEFVGGSGEVALTILRWNLAQPLYIGWGAVYAGEMEVRYGFFEHEAGNWPHHIEQARKRIVG